MNSMTEELSMLSKRLVRIINAAVIIAAVGAYIAWRRHSYLDVDVTAFHAGATIELAAVEGHALTGGEQWFTVQPGPNSLTKGAYLFKVKTSDREKIGLIAIDDASPIVLK